MARRLRPIHLAVLIGLCVVAGGGAVAFGWVGPHSSGSGGPSPAADTGSVPAPRLVVSPADGATGVPLDAPVNVAAADGQLLGVNVTTTAGAATPAALTTPGPQPGSGPASLPGQLASGNWTSSAPLQPGATYKVAAFVADAKGKATALTTTFTTVTPQKVLKVSISPLNGQTVGVGMPLALYLSQPVTDHNGFLSHIQVTTDPPVAGAWHWFSDTEVHYRPQAYWPSGTKVTFDGVLAGWDDGGGVWAVTPRHMTFTVGPSHISTVDAGTHQMTVTEGGQVVKVMPVSTGRDKYPTDSGVHVVSEKEPSVVMDSATVGIPRDSPDGYYETVQWDVRISNSGEFVHAAPWSLSDQGHQNVSHGCVNLSVPDGQWFFNFSTPGDIVTVVGTPVPLSPTNGFGDWNVGWDQWAN